MNDQPATESKTVTVSPQFAKAQLHANGITDQDGVVLSRAERRRRGNRRPLPPGWKGGVDVMVRANLPD